MRVLIWLALALIVYLALKSKARRMQENMRNAVRAEFEAQAASQANQANQANQRPNAPAENMVACAHCQIYLPASEAVHLTTPNSELFFCSEAHLRLHSSQSPPSSHSAEHE